MTTLFDSINSYPADLPLERARTIPREWYVDPAMLALERSAVFRASWQVVARADEVAAPGSYVSVDVAGEPVLIVRGQDSVLRGFFNVCRHKGTRIVGEGHGVCDKLRCRYHGWTYDLGGRLRGTPEWDGVLDFRKEENGLTPVTVDTWGPFVFASLSPPAEPLSAFVAPIALDLSAFVFATRRTYDLACDWKVFVDNYLDGGYHVSTVHPELAGVLDYSGYTTECFGKTSLQSSPLRAAPKSDAASVRKGDRATYWWLWPNFMINVYDGVMDTNLVLPLGPERCRVIIDFWFTRGTQATHVEKSIAVAHAIQEEDIFVSEEVQRGLRSVSYDHGRFSVAREVAGYHFHKLLVAALRAKTAPAPLVESDRR